VPVKIVKARAKDMSLRKSVVNFRYMWMTSLTLFGCFALFFIFQNHTEAVELKTPAGIDIKASPANVQVLEKNDKGGVDVNSGNFQWITFVFAGGFVGCGGFLVKQLIDGKDERIKYLEKAKDDSDKLKDQEIKMMTKEYESRITSLNNDNQRLEKKIQANNDFETLVSTIVSDLNKQGVTSETDSNLRKIVDALNEYKNYEKEIEPLHQNVGKWIRNRKNIWLDNMIQHTTYKYPEELKDRKVEFTKDISECLEWLYDSTYYNISHHFSDYLPKRSIDSILPYRACFNYLKQKNDIGDLTYEEADFFKKYLDELIQLF